MIYLGSNRLKKIYVGGTKIKKAYVGATRVYSAGNYVTYYVDTDESYTEEVEYEASCLSPTTFTPSKSGWTFLGWRQDTTATSSVLSSLTMDDESITLYAVFKRSVTLTYYSTSSTASTTTGTRYYNNGNYKNPTFTISNPSVSGWTFQGWISGSTSATETVSYSKISSTSFSASATLYAKFSQTITLSYNGNSSSSGSTSSQTGTRYWNVYGDYSNPEFTLASCGFSKTGYSFSAWAISSASGTQYSAGDSVTLSASTTFYAVWTSNAYSVSFSSSVWTISKTEPGDEDSTSYSFGTNLTMSASKGSSVANYCSISASATLDTKGCNRVTISWWANGTADTSNFTVGSSQYSTGSSSGSKTLTISGSSIYVALSASDSSNDGTDAYIVWTGVSFYNA